MEQHDQLVIFNEEQFYYNITGLSNYIHNLIMETECIKKITLEHKRERGKFDNEIMKLENNIDDTVLKLLKIRMEITSYNNM